MSQSCSKLQVVVIKLLQQVQRDVAHPVTESLPVERPRHLVRGGLHVTGGEPVPHLVVSEHVRLPGHLQPAGELPQNFLRVGHQVLVPSSVKCREN